MALGLPVWFVLGLEEYNYVFLGDDYESVYIYMNIYIFICVCRLLMTYTMASKSSPLAFGCGRSSYFFVGEGCECVCGGLGVLRVA